MAKPISGRKASKREAPRYDLQAALGTSQSRADNMVARWGSQPEAIIKLCVKWAASLGRPAQGPPAATSSGGRQRRAAEGLEHRARPGEGGGLFIVPTGQQEQQSRRSSFRGLAGGG